MENFTFDGLLQYNKSISERHKDACTPLFQNFGITTFTYSRFYYDGQYLMVSNQFEWLETWLEKIYSPNNTLLEQAVQSAQIGKFSYLLWPAVPHQDLLLSFNATFNICNGFDVYRRLEDSVEVWSMATTQANENGRFLFLNNIRQITNFCLLYNETCSDIISHNNSNTLKTFHSSMNMTLNKELLFEKELNAFLKAIEARKLLFSPKLGSISLTHRETECLAQLAKGKSAKEIGRVLKISPRTVETYLNKVKEKTGKERKSNLIDWYYETIID